jgi:GntR family transcriptional regulator, transcriptional repressor for pyruvate dehydrogenase complex
MAVGITTSRQLVGAEAFMQALLKPIKTESLSAAFVSRFEELILSGQISIGQRLPAERELALLMGVSRPVVHEGLMHLAHKGLVAMKSRNGTVVSDYRQVGSLSLLNSLLHYQQGRIEPRLLASLIEMRLSLETETARLAARRRTGQQLKDLRRLIALEKQAKLDDIETVTDLDFRFHHLLALASNNFVYPLLLNSFKEVYTNLTRTFFASASHASKVFKQHGRLLAAVNAKDDEAAAALMQKLLMHGAAAINRAMKHPKSPARDKSRGKVMQNFLG